MNNTNDKKTGAPRSLDGLVGCPICGEPRSEFQRGKTMTVHGDYVGVEACDWCGSTFFTSTLDGEMEPSPKAPNVEHEPRALASRAPCSCSPSSSGGDL